MSNPTEEKLHQTVINQIRTQDGDVKAVIADGLLSTGVASINYKSLYVFSIGKASFPWDRDNKPAGFIGIFGKWYPYHPSTDK